MRFKTKYNAKIHQTPILGWVWEFHCNIYCLKALHVVLLTLSANAVHCQGGVQLILFAIGFLSESGRIRCLCHKTLIHLSILHNGNYDQLLLPNKDQPIHSLFKSNDYFHHPSPLHLWLQSVSSICCSAENYTILSCTIEYVRSAFYVLFVSLFVCVMFHLQLLCILYIYVLRFYFSFKNKNDLGMRKKWLKKLCLNGSFPFNGFFFSRNS